MLAMAMVAKTCLKDENENERYISKVMKITF